MSLTIKRLLGQFDLFLGYITSVLMHVFLYAFSVVFCVLGVAAFIFGPFETGFSLNELDNLELLGFACFVFVMVRFFKRSKSVGLSVWLRLKRYVFISALVTAFYSTIFAFVLMSLLHSHGELGISDLNANSDFQYFSFCILYLLSLYAFTPLPKLSWMSKDTEKQGSIEKPDAEPASANSTEEKADFFTDSTGNTRADSMNADNKQ